MKSKSIKMKSESNHVRQMMIVTEKIESTLNGIAYFERLLKTCQENRRLMKLVDGTSSHFYHQSIIYRKCIVRLKSRLTKFIIDLNELSNGYQTTLTRAKFLIS